MFCDHQRLGGEYQHEDWRVLSRLSLEGCCILEMSENKSKILCLSAESSSQPLLSNSALHLTQISFLILQWKCNLWDVLSCVPILWALAASPGGTHILTLTLWWHNFLEDLAAWLPAAAGGWYCEHGTPERRSLKTWWWPTLLSDFLWKWLLHIWRGPGEPPLYPEGKKVQKCSGCNNSRPRWVHSVNTASLQDHLVKTTAH